jgi:hypothetical protein
MVEVFICLYIVGTGRYTRRGYSLVYSFSSPCGYTGRLIISSYTVGPISLRVLVDMRQAVFRSSVASPKLDPLQQRPYSRCLLVGYSIFDIA